MKKRLFISRLDCKIKNNVCIQADSTVECILIAGRIVELNNGTYGSEVETLLTSAGLLTRRPSVISARATVPFAFSPEIPGNSAVRPQVALWRPAELLPFFRPIEPLDSFPVKVHQHFNSRVELNGE